jgi:hypothetical protein
MRRGGHGEQVNSAAGGGGPGKVEQTPDSPTSAAVAQARRGTWCATLAALGSLAVMALAGGCDSHSDKGAARGPAMQAQTRDALFDSVAQNFDRLEEYDVNLIMPQICDRLNQWYNQQRPEVAWQADPLISELSDEIENLRAMQTLDTVRFRMPDAWNIQETVWLRDISANARADKFADVDVARQLFDWTVRNIQLDADGGDPSTTRRHHPFETLLFGRGDALDRAWVFMLLARQQGLDVVLLALPDAEGKNLRPWATALVSDGQLYLFDCRLGLPIPGPGGKGVATLEQVAAEDGLLRTLDVDAEHPYPVKAADLDGVVALVEASPQSLSRRMALVESKLSGKHKLVLTSPGASLAERVKKLKHVSDARLWPHPFEIALWQSTLNEAELLEAARETYVFQAVPALMTGRALYFKGEFEGEKGAKVNFLEARPSDEVINAYRLPPQEARQIKREDISRAEAARIVTLRNAKRNASLWLGLVCYEQEKYPAAIDFFQKRVLDATPDGPWTPSARYNLARTYEAQGKPELAIALLEADDSPQSHGNKLRARWLREGSAAVARE